VYEDNKKKNKDFKFSDALKLASKQYNKRGGKSDLPEDAEKKNVVDMDANSEEPAPVKAVVDSEIEVKDVVVEPETEVKVKDVVVEPESADEEEVVPMDTSEGGKKKNKTKKGGKPKKSQRKSKKSQRKSKRNHRK
jgi:hypothetical protein